MLSFSTFWAAERVKMDLARLCVELDISADSEIGVAGFELLDWGRQLRLRCHYHTHQAAAQPFAWWFDDVREMRWRLYIHHQGEQTALVDLLLGTGGHRKPAQLLTDAFALSLLYGAYRLETAL